MAYWKFFLVFLVLLALASPVIAHEGHEPYQNVTDRPFDWSDPVLYIKISALLLVLSAIILVAAGPKFKDRHKKLFFWFIVIIVALPSLYLAGHTIYENMISETGGPVHWHADYQVWACGERLDLVNPDFPSNKVGTPLFHEHDDDRIHVEGTVLDVGEVSLGKYFEVIGGELYQGHLRYPTETGVVDLEDGDLCGNQSSTLKVYANGERIENYYSYLYYPDAYVPPGDCIIIEFGPGNASTTEKICESWAAKGWNYEDYKRPEVSMGDRIWR